MTRVDERILEKIRKALALANDNPTDAEALSAMAMAQKLMVKHGIEVGDIGTGQEKKEVIEGVASNFRKHQEWEKHLSVIVAENFKCTSYMTKMQTGPRYAVTRIQFLGLKQDVEIAQMVYNYAHDTIQMLVKAFIDNNGYRGAGKTVIGAAKTEFRRGFLQGMSSKFKEQIKQESWGLVLVKDALVIQAEEDLGLKKGYESRASYNPNAAARKAGYDEGRNFDRPGNRLKG